MGKYDFNKFKLKINNTLRRFPINDRSYRYGYSSADPVSDFTLEEIQDIIKSGDIESIRLLSRYFYRVNSVYRNNIDFLAHMPLYDTVVIPQYEETKGSKT